ncbi:hypothetical protein SODALDRAFT_106051 [Sodiomyces alkalinus F11]|uniref:Uncharacterized protein n=1 Tax=Sodiomyces alkalinus (strain CBS 110278 / VKM F-3762 / F11) TaxID=1314773 RepID=A0A3N2Q249_SODAK|nr:hypothetical protein SODALDRAFT_106051 [Sodiomyces alkalinus F11]ROT40851.1 hypothetical protein SODALDRAFT_106051 [Sodiomyces alkalinus F11]
MLKTLLRIRLNITLRCNRHITKVDTGYPPASPASSADSVFLLREGKRERIKWCGRAPRMITGFYYVSCCIFQALLWVNSGNGRRQGRGVSRVLLEIVLSPLFYSFLFLFLLLLLSHQVCSPVLRYDANGISKRGPPVSINTNCTYQDQVCLLMRRILEDTCDAISQTWLRMGSSSKVMQSCAEIP